VFTGITATGAVASLQTVNVSNNLLGTNASDSSLINYQFANAGSGNLGINVTGSTSATTHLIENNTIRGIKYRNPGNTNTGTWAFITFTAGTAAADSASIKGNNFTNMNINTTGAVTFISHSYAVAATGKQYITNNNIVTGFTKAGAGGSITCMTSSGSSAAGAIVNHSNNTFNNINATGACALTGISHSGGSPTLTSTGNSFQNWVTGAGAVTGISYGSFAGTSSVYNNTIYNLRDTNALVVGMIIGATTSSANPLNVYNNTVAKLISFPNATPGTGGNVVGFQITNTSTLVNVYGNIIDTLSTSGTSGNVTGLAVGAANATNVYKNKIYNLTTNTGTVANANGVVAGLSVSGGTTVNLYNNLISNLDALADTASNAVIGLNVTGGTTVNAYHNTIRVAATSTSGAFSTSGIYATAAPALTLINNIVSNTSSFGTGKTVAYRRALGTAGTIPSGYSSTSNNNLFYAGTPGANNLIYLEGVIPTSGTANSQTTLKNYKSFMNSGAQPRDQAAVSENISFVSTNGLSADFLKYPLSNPWRIQLSTLPTKSVTSVFTAYSSIEIWHLLSPKFALHVLLNICKSD
jgi:hypothetical protein